MPDWASPGCLRERQIPLERDKTVKKLALTAAAAAATLSLSFAANAQDWDHSRQYAPPPAPILGEGGAHFANQCWVETWGAGSSYFGYWKDCGPAPKVARH